MLVLLGAAAVAWVALVLSHSGDGSSFLDHERLAGPDAHGAAGLHHEHHPAGADVGDLVTPGVVVLAGWSVMVLAMMVPPALPMLTMVRQLVARRRNPWLLFGAGLGAFASAWIAVGAALVVGDAILHRTTADLAPSWHISNLVPGLVLAGAGVYQFTPLKNACLQACRSPRGFALAHWQGRRTPATEVMTVTGAYALSCIGCCWALMAISFAVGVAALPVMVALAVLMAGERLVPWGRRLVQPAGVLLVVLGAATCLRPFLPT